MQEFWHKWLKANELEKERIVETLPLLPGVIYLIKKPFRKKEDRLYTLASTINNYLMDLDEFLKERRGEK